MKKLVIGGGVFVVLLAIGLANQKREAEEIAANPELQRAQIEAEEDREMISQARVLMRRRMKDPESAQFSDVMVVRASGKPIVCGDVNAKNSFGGYTGRKGFVMPKGGVPIGEEDLPQKDWVNLWNQSCTSKAKPSAGDAGPEK